MGKGSEPYKPSKEKLIDTGWNLKQLGTYLGNNYDVSLLGDTHGSQPVADAQGVIFKNTKSEVLYMESSPSSQKVIDSRNESKLGDNWGVTRTAIKEAFREKINVKTIDGEPSLLPSHTKALTIAAQVNGGSTERLRMAVGLAVDYLERNKVDIGSYKPDEELSPKDRVNEFIARFNDKLPDFHKENLRNAASIEERSNNPGLGARIENTIKYIPESIRTANVISDRRKDGDNIMAKNVAEDMASLRGRDPDANSTVINGMSHNKGMEKKLERQGYNTANVKVYPTDDKNLDGKVFTHKPNGKEDAEFVVTVYDPDHLKVKAFKETYSLPEAKQQPDKEHKAVIDPKHLPQGNNQKQR